MKSAQDEDELEKHEEMHNCKIEKSEAAPHQYKVSFAKTLGKNLSENDAVEEF